MIFLFLMLATQTVYGAAKLQDADFKTVQQLINGGGSAAQLLNDSKIYVTANGINQQLSSAIQSGLIGGGGGTNLLSNGGFEASGVAGWSTFQTTLSNLVPTGAPATCSSCTFAIGAQTSGALAGATSLQLTGAATTTPGQGFISQAFTVAPAYRGQVMNVKGVFSVVTGLAALNLSGTAANSFALYIYDVTNGAWIQPSGTYAMASSGGPFAPVSFQVPSNTTSLRFAVVNVNAIAGATTQLFDELVVGPGALGTGTVITDWQLYTPTVTATANPTRPTARTEIAKWRRVGSDIEVEYYLSYTNSAGGVQGSGVYNFSLPPIGVQIDIARLQTTGNGTSVGVFRVIDGSNSAYGVSSVANANSFYLQGKYSATNAAGTPTDFALGSNAFGFTNPTMFLSFTAKAPIVGWSSNVAQSSDYDGRNVNFAGVVTGTTANNTNITMTPTTDKAGGWNGSVYVVQAAGDYMLNGSVLSPQQPFTGQFVVNGVVSTPFTYVINTSTASVGSMLAPNLKVGDTIAMRGVGNGVSISVTGGNLSITRMPGSSPVLQASQSVNATYGLSANQSVGSNQVIKFETRATDNLNSYSPTTGLFTCPVAGQYRASIVAQTNSVNSLAFMRKIVGGVTSGAGYIAGLPNNSIGAGSISFRCNVGDSFGIYLDVGATLTGANASGFVSQATFERTGN